jgi:3-deoxy-D-manno-octulosonic-acid transferase
MRLLYNAALLPLRAASWIYGAWPGGTPSAVLERSQRLGRRLPSISPGAVWIHGASVGEARLVASLAAALRSARPGSTILASAVTPAGRAQLPGPPSADASFFLPLDFSAVQRRAFDALRPAAVVLVETEIWPNLLFEAASRRVPVVLVNARLAPERWARYRRLRRLYEPLLAGLAAVAAPSDFEAERFRALGAAGGRIVVTGNLKFDLSPPAADEAELRRTLGLRAGRPVVVAGSTGEGEDDAVLEAFALARRFHPDLLLVLAPRHADRFAGAAVRVEARGLRVHRISRGDTGAAAADVLLVDLFGRLSALYALGAGSFVGGSLVPVGGHNLLEPLGAGSPVLFGPHTEHVAEIAEALVLSGAGLRVRSADELGAAWLTLLADPAERERRSAVGRTLLAANRGALSRTIRLVVDVLEGRP